MATRRGLTNSIYLFFFFIFLLNSFLDFLIFFERCNHPLTNFIFFLVLPFTRMYRHSLLFLYWAGQVINKQKTQDIKAFVSSIFHQWIC